jgi:hypothetical protein
MPTNLNAPEISPHLSALIDKFMPETIRARHPAFVDFLQAYFNFLEDFNGASYFQNTLPQQRDLYYQEEEFLRQIEKEIGLFVPREYASDPKDFYSRISELWRAKGSEDAIKTFFLLFLDDPVEINLPWEKVLKPSDGNWVADRKVRVSIIEGNPEDFIGKTITQINLAAYANVDKVEKVVYSDGIVYEFTIIPNTQFGEFTDQAEIIVQGTNLRAEIYRSVTSVNVINGGSNYKVGDRIQIDRFEGYSFVAYVTSIGPIGNITGVQIANHGAGSTPLHIRAANTEELYYKKDFILYMLQLLLHQKLTFDLKLVVMRILQLAMVQLLLLLEDTLIQRVNSLRQLYCRIHLSFSNTHMK